MAPDINARTKDIPKTMICSGIFIAFSPSRLKVGTPTTEYRSLIALKYQTPVLVVMFCGNKSLNGFFFVSPHQHPLLKNGLMCLFKTVL